MGHERHTDHVITQVIQSGVARKSKEISKLLYSRVRDTARLPCIWIRNNPTSNKYICTALNRLSANNMAMQSIPLIHNQLFSSPECVLTLSMKIPLLIKFSALQKNKVKKGIFSRGEINPI